MPQIYMCPLCKSLYDSDVGTCPKCGRSVVPGGPEAIAAWLTKLGASEEDKIVKDMIEDSPRIKEIKTKLENLRKLAAKVKEVDRVNMDHIFDMIASIENKVMRGDVEIAEREIARCAEELNERSMQFKVLSDAIKVALHKIEKADELGGNVEEARKMIRTAKKLMKIYDYENAISYAIKGSVIADKVIAECRAWHVEIQDWLK